MHSSVSLCNSLTRKSTSLPSCCLAYLGPFHFGEGRGFFQYGGWVGPGLFFPSPTFNYTYNEIMADFISMEYRGMKFEIRVGILIRWIKSLGFN